MKRTKFTALSLTLFSLLTCTVAFGEWSTPVKIDKIIGSENSLPVITPEGDVPDDLVWYTFAEGGKTVPFQVVGEHFVLLAATPGTYRIFAWGNGDSGNTRQTIVTLRSDGSVGPPTPPVDEGPYPDLVKDISDSIDMQPGVSDEEKKADALTLFFFYGNLSERIAKDAERATPLLKSVSDVGDMLKTEEEKLLAGTDLPSVKEKYKGFAVAAGKKFLEIFGEEPPANDELTPMLRKTYVEFTRSISLGCGSSAWRD